MACSSISRRRACHRGRMACTSTNPANAKVPISNPPAVTGIRGAKQHGFDNPQGAHAGDFFNLDIGADGTGALEAMIPGATLKDGDNALLDADGAAFVVHEGPDDLKTDPSGESGGRLACGVFVGGR